MTLCDQFGLIFLIKTVDSRYDLQTSGYSCLFPSAAVPKTWLHVLRPSGHDETGRR